jgi:hypothetical protein
MVMEHAQGSIVYVYRGFIFSFIYLNIFTSVRYAQISVLVSAHYTKGMEYEYLNN